MGNINVYIDKTTRIGKEEYSDNFLTVESSFYQEYFYLPYYLF